MPLTDRVKQIISWYGSDNPGVRANLVRMMNHGTLSGTGKMVILPVDQGFEHGPARSFQPNPDGYDPDFHVQLAVDSGCNAYAAPLGFLEFVADRYAGQIPLILKLNNSDTLAKVDQPCSAVTGSVKDAVRMGCAAIGYTIHPGSGQRNQMYPALRGLVLGAKRQTASEERHDEHAFQEDESEHEVVGENHGLEDREFPGALAHARGHGVAATKPAVGVAAPAMQAGFTGPAAGKTGTAPDGGDAWFIGSTTSLRMGKSI